MKMSHRSELEFTKGGSRGRQPTAAHFPPRDEFGSERAPAGGRLLVLPLSCIAFVRRHRTRERGR